MFQTLSYQLSRLAQQINLNALPKTDASTTNLQKGFSIVFVITGAIAVMMVVIGGIKYASSQGDAQATAKAKNTVIYALVGLALSIFATAIVGFISGQVL